MGSLELQRTDSICTPPQLQLLEYVKVNHVPKIKSFVAEYPKTLNTIIGHPHDKSILQIACCELADEVKAETVDALIELGADLYFATDDVDDQMEALHYAAVGGNPNILRTIIRRISPEKINSQTEHYNTALNLLVKRGDFTKENYLECIRVLLKAGIDANKADSKNLTPILWAAKKGYAKVVEVILSGSYQEVDIDNHKLKGKSARDYMIENCINFTVFASNNNASGDGANWYALLKEHKEDEFIANGVDISSINADDGVQTLLQLATIKGLSRAVDYLLKIGADPNHTTYSNPAFPISLAATRGYHEVVKLLLEVQELKIPSNILIDVLKHVDDKKVVDYIDYDLCYKLLVKKLKKSEINATDFSNKTALHYAARYGGSEKVLELLRVGASLACKNEYGVLPVEDVDANTLETHLNECMITNVDANIDKENFTASFNYRTLMPPASQFECENSTDVDPEAVSCKLFANEIEQLSRETQVISYMSKSPELKHLLKHPTITSFLYMKWHRIRWFFYTNLAFYITFCLLLVLYILLVYGNRGDNESKDNVLFWLLLITFVMLILRELFQMTVSPKNYFCNFENYLELLIIVLTGCIFKESPSEDFRKQISAFTVLLIALGMVLLIGQHPKMSTNIVMLRTVSVNFFKFFLWYSILIIAFSLSFYILLKDSRNEVDKKDDDEEVNFFINPGLSFFKTIVMLTGEFDAGSINFDVYPVTSHIIFMLFVIMIAIILFNLLNGLAVSDTQMIKSNAELVGHIARIEHIAYIESMLLGHILPGGLVNCCQKYFCCLSLRVRERLIVPGVLMKRVCLFPYFLKDYKLVVYPNQYGRVALSEENEPDNCTTTCTSIYLDKQTSKRIKQMIRERREMLIKERLEESSVSKQNEIIKEQQKDIEKLKRTLENAENGDVSQALAKARFEVPVTKIQSTSKAKIYTVDRLIVTYPKDLRCVLIGYISTGYDLNGRDYITQ
ncbi:hypothetical protein FQA39_LY10266 [Lamprigera yunnana]|nr:hypothetical protein FQA39_LY10266 [Lamprigera yunnana]